MWYGNENFSAVVVSAKKKNTKKSYGRKLLELKNFIKNSNEGVGKTHHNDDDD